MNTNIKKGKMIKSEDFKNTIREYINELGTFNVNGSYYNMLNKKTINSLKTNISYISLKSFGKCYILFLTKIKNKDGYKNYSVFINKKNQSFILTKFKFNSSIFDGTLLDGELVKNFNGEWVFLINDLPYFKGENIITTPFSQRYKLIKSMIENEYKEDLNISMCKIDYKRNYELNNIMYLFNLQEKLNYKCSGLYFKNENNFSDNYLYIFPECRSDYKVNQMKNNGLIQQTSPTQSSVNVQDTPLPQGNLNMKIVNNKCSFEIRVTERSSEDIYELYAYNRSNILERIGVASIQDIKTSNFCKNLLMDKEKDIVLCSYNKHFKKWKPLEQSNKIDNIQTINIVQNL